MRSRSCALKRSPIGISSACALSTGSQVKSTGDSARTSTRRPTRASAKVATCRRASTSTKSPSESITLISSCSKPMHAPASNDPTPRAELIRALIAEGFPTHEIKRRCVQLLYDEPSDQAISRAKHYKLKGRPAASRPSYYWLWKQLLAEYDRARTSGTLVVITKEMHTLIATADACLTRDLSREPLTKRRRKAKK